MDFEVVNLLPFQPSSYFESGQTVIQTAKFVLLRCGTKTYMVIGLVDTFEYHADLIRNFCETRSIQYTEAGMQKIELSKDWQVLGGGWMKFLPDQKSITIYGQSTAYGRFDAKYLKQEIEKQPIFSQIPVSFTA